MNKPISITVYGNAVPKGRPRVALRGKHPVVYTPTKTREWEQLIKLAAAGKVKELMTGPIELDVEFYLPRPKSLPNRITYHTKRPDLDNLIKAVMDALNGVVWRDDSQVVEKHVYKYYACSERPHVTIDILEMKEG